MGGLTSAYPQQFELAEFQQAANCTLELAENPENCSAECRGSWEMAICRRWPSACRPNRWSLPPTPPSGNYGGTLMGTSRATESGTSDLFVGAPCEPCALF